MITGCRAARSMTTDLVLDALEIGIWKRQAYTGFEGDSFSRRFEEAGFGWATDKIGRFYGDSGIRLRARDLANFGQLYLDGGRWHGQQLVPETGCARPQPASSLPAMAGSGGMSMPGSICFRSPWHRRAAGARGARTAPSGSHPVTA
jgi:CubicO group peptidase (beta-lactamase class C family)